jgi:hypothetical protein
MAAFKKIVPIVLARTDTPDETYVVSRCRNPWHAVPLLIDGQSYCDLAPINDPVHFAMDEAGNLV